MSLREIPSHVLEHQPFPNQKSVTPNIVMRGLKRLAPKLVDLTIGRQRVYFLTQTSNEPHFVDCHIKESGRVVIARLQAEAGAPTYHPAKSHFFEHFEYYKDEGLYPILEDPSFVPSQLAQPDLVDTKH